jgi:hypothetical protein
VESLTLSISKRAASRGMRGIGDALTPDATVGRHAGRPWHPPKISHALAASTPRLTA